MKANLKLVACAIVLAGCRGKKQDVSSGDAVVAPATTAMPVTQAAWDPDAIDELVAPIALYPDQLVGQILAASVNTQEVLDAGNWLLENQTLKGDQLDAAAQKAGFGAATRALVQFPTVIDMLCQEIDWTKQLGAAFTSDQKGVLDAIQRLRAQAADVGNLKTTPQQTVEHKSEEGKEVIEVKPADPKVVYVPQYDPTIIYTTPPPAPAPAPAPAPQPNTVSTSTAVGGALLAFGVGMLVGSAINNNDYYYPHYGPGAVYYGPRPFYPPAYVYRPVYGPAFHPAYRYAPPASYRYRYNSPTNIVINNNNNYYNRFSNQNNIRVNTNQRNVTAGNRVGQPGNAGRGQNWKGQSTYAGARPGGAADRKPGVNDRTPNVPDRRATTADRKATPQRNQAAAAQRPATGAKAQPRGGQRPNEVASANTRDRGYGGATQAGSRDAPNRQVAAGEVATRDVGNGNRAQPKAAASSAPRENALSGASRDGSGSFDRAASARGHASASAAPKRPSGGARRP